MRGALITALGAAAMAFALGACGSDDTSGSSGTGGKASGGGGSGGVGASGGTTSGGTGGGGTGGSAGTLPQEIPAWAASSLHRVRKDEPASPPANIELWAGRGEWESFQVLMRAPAGLHGVSVSASDLAGPGGASIPSSAFTLYREHWMYVQAASPDWNGSNRPSGVPGWFTDPLIPANDPATGADLTGATLDAQPFDVPADETNAFWLDVLVPRTTAAGDYSGVVSVTSQEGTTSLPLTLHVWNFELPLAPSLKSSFLVWSATSRATYEELLRNKLMPGSVDPADEPDLIANDGLSATDVGFWSGADVGTCSMQPAPSVSQIQAAVATHAPGLFLYDYSADEIDACQGLYPTLKSWAANLHAAGVKNLVTMTPNPQLFDDGTGSGAPAVDIWVVLPVMYDAAPSAVAQALAAGHEVWSYNTLVQDAYSPKWEIDFSPLDFRIQAGFLSQSLALTGLLYWRVDYWGSDPWNDANEYSLSGNAYPGEAKLVYPGDAVGIAGVAPSIRLKWLRDGVEDYEYVELLKKKGQATSALDAAKKLAPDWTSWTRDAVAVETTRRTLGAELDALGP